MFGKVFRYWNRYYWDLVFTVMDSRANRAVTLLPVSCNCFNTKEIFKKTLALSPSSPFTFQSFFSKLNQILKYEKYLFPRFNYCYFYRFFFFLIAWNFLLFLWSLIIFVVYIFHLNLKTFSIPWFSLPIFWSFLILSY